jgi:hypothetical protein
MELGGAKVRKIFDTMTKKQLPPKHIAKEFGVKPNSFAIETHITVFLLLKRS